MILLATYFFLFKYPFQKASKDRPSSTDCIFLFQFQETVSGDSFMRRWLKLLILVAVICVGVYASYFTWYFKPQAPERSTSNVIMKLPSPELIGTMSVEEAIFKRRSIRDYVDKPLTLKQLSQLLWAAQGITDPRWRFRVAPSAGATYPLEVYVVVGKDGVAELGVGVYHYNPNDHTLGLVFTGDLRSELSTAALGQQWIAKAPSPL